MNNNFTMYLYYNNIREKKNNVKYPFKQEMVMERMGKVHFSICWLGLWGIMQGHYQLKL